MHFKHISRIHVIVLFLTSTIVLVNLVGAQQFVTDGLVAFYTLDKTDIKAGVVKDVSGNSNDAKIMGTNSHQLSPLRLVNLYNWMARKSTWRYHHLVRWNKRLSNAGH